MSKMKLVPASVTKYIGHALESNIFECLPPSPVHAANWREGWKNAIKASPSKGMVSEKIFERAVSAASAGLHDRANPYEIARAVIEALGLEIEP